MRAGGAAAPERDGEDVRDLEQQARERPVRVLRKRPEQPTVAEVLQKLVSSVCCRQRTCEMPMWSDLGFPNIGVDYGYLWCRAPEASDASHDEVAGEDPPDGVRTSSPVLCGRCSVDRWIFGHLCQTKGDNERNRAVLAKELQAGGHTRVVVRSDGVNSIPPNTENWLRKLYDKNYNNDTSTEDKHETNYSMNNDTRNMHIT